MVLPDTPERERPTSYRLPALSAVALVSVTMALVLGRFTSPPDPFDPSDAVMIPDPTTTTVLSEPEVVEHFTEQGHPLLWETVANIGDHSPVAIVEVEGEALVFTAPSATPSGDHGQILLDNPARYGGLFLWDPGQTPAALSARVIPSGNRIHAVENTSFGLIALGTDVATGEPSTWASDDGREWGRLDLRDPSGQPLHVYESHSHGETTILLASTWVEDGLGRARREAIEQHGNAAVSLLYLSPRYHGVFGVLGIHLGVIRDDIPANVQSRSYVLRTGDGVSWEMTDLEELIRVGVRMSNLVTSPEGAIWGLVYESDGPVVYQYHGEGSGWGRLQDRSLTRPGGMYFHLMVAQPWSGAHLALPFDAQGSPTLVVSEDLREWDEIFDFATILDLESSDNWAVQAWDTGPNDIVMAVHWFGLALGLQPEEPARTLHKDGFDLEVTRHSIRLLGPDADITVSRYYSHPHSRVEIDPDDHSIVFLDTVGSELIRFGQAELAAVDVRPTSAVTPASMTQAFLHSTDGETWTIQDISALTRGAWVAQLAVIGDRVYLVTGSHSHGRYQPRNDQGKILTARIP